MADNFLEKRMDDYRRGALRQSASRRSGRLSASADRTVLLLGYGLEALEAAVSRFRSAGWRVAFMLPDAARGRQLAQTTGSQHHPADPADADAVERAVRHIADRWGRLDLAVMCGCVECGTAIESLFAELGVALVRS